MEWLIPLLVFLSVACVGGAVIVAQLARRKAVAARLVQIGAFEGESLAPVSSWKQRSLGLLHRLGHYVSVKGPSAQLRAEMTRAGYHNFLAAEIFLGIKILLLVVALVSLTLLVPPLRLSAQLNILLIVGGAALLWFVPNLIVRLRRQRRAAEVGRALPDAIDMLEICVTAGMGIDMAWNSVADEIRRVSTVLADEMTLTNLEIHLGTTRGVAMRNMAGRTQADEVLALAGVFSQSEQFGTSVSDALRTFAESMREQRSQKAQEAAERMAVKLLLPMIFFIFPTVLIVAAGPAVIKLIDLFGN